MTLPETPEGAAPAPSRRHALLRRVIQLVVVGASLGYVGRVLSANWSELEQQRAAFSPWLALASVPFGFGYVVARGLLWHHIIVRIGGPSPVKLDVAVWLASTLGKYLPGKVFMLLGRVFVYRQRGLSLGAVTLGFLYEMAVLFATAFILTVGVIDIPPQAGWQSVKWLAGLGVLAFLVGSQPEVLAFVARRVPRFSPTTERLGRVRRTDPLLWTGLMMATWCILGAGLFVLTRAFVDVPLSAAPHLTASYAVAGVLGIAVVLAPSGLGVREGVLTVLLTPSLGPGAAATLALASRVWITIAEVLSALVALPYARVDVRLPTEASTPEGSREGD